MRAFFKARVRLWPVILLFVAGIVGTGYLVTMATTFSIFGVNSHTESTQVIYSMTREEQVVLLSLGVQGLEEQTDKSKVFGVEVPWSERATLIQYAFHAKLGIDGADVVITNTSDNKYTVDVPEFTFIGYDDPDLKVASENAGGLSWFTPEVDITEMFTQILGGAEKQQYIDDNAETLREQTEAFYTSIVEAIDPDIELEFVFAGEISESDAS